MTAGSPDPGRDRVDASAEAPLSSRDRPAEPGLLEAGVYPSRPVEPLPDAVSAALESPSREEVRRGLDTGSLWRDPVLRSRLVQAFGDHVERCGARRIVAGDSGVASLAAAVAERLVLPLERAETERSAEDVGRAAYLVARVLHEREEGRFFPGTYRGEGRPSRGLAGAGALFRIRSSRPDDPSVRNVMYITDI